MIKNERSFNHVFSGRNRWCHAGCGTQNLALRSKLLETLRKQIWPLGPTTRGTTSSSWFSSRDGDGKSERLSNPLSVWTAGEICWIIWKWCFDVFWLFKFPSHLRCSLQLTVNPGGLMVIFRQCGVSKDSWLSWLLQQEPWLQSTMHWCRWLKSPLFDGHGGSRGLGSCPHFCGPGNACCRYRFSGPAECMGVGFWPTLSFHTCSMAWVDPLNFGYLSWLWFWVKWGVYWWPGRVSSFRVRVWDWAQVRPY